MGWTARTSRFGAPQGALMGPHAGVGASLVRPGTRAQAVPDSRRFRVRKCHVSSPARRLRSKRGSRNTRGVARLGACDGAGCCGCGGESRMLDAGWPRCLLQPVVERRMVMLMPVVGFGIGAMAVIFAELGRLDQRSRWMAVLGDHRSGAAGVAVVRGASLTARPPSTTWVMTRSGYPDTPTRRYPPRTRPAQPVTTRSANPGTCHSRRSAS